MLPLLLLALLLLPLPLLLLVLLWVLLLLLGVEKVARLRGVGTLSVVPADSSSRVTPAVGRETHVRVW